MSRVFPLITVARQLEVPLLVVILLGACAAKLVRVLRTGTLAAAMDATALFPVRLRRPVTIALCLTELSLGLGLALTANGDGVGSDSFRVATGVFFLIAMSALLEVRERRPDLGCGCFGELSVRPVGYRSIIRTGALACAGLSSLGAPGLHLPPPGLRALTDLAILVAELLLLAALSPEVGEVLIRLGYSEPCETRAANPQRALHSLHRSRIWRKHIDLLAADDPVDMWRELCWWYLVYPGRGESFARDVVFAVQVRHRRPAVRAAVVRLDAADLPVPAADAADSLPDEQLFPAP